jgi:hypothetical protein
MLQDYTRHVGRLDVVRELADGVTGVQRSTGRNRPRSPPGWVRTITGAREVAPERLFLDRLERVRLEWRTAGETRSSAAFDHADTGFGDVP